MFEKVNVSDRTVVVFCILVMLLNITVQADVIFFAMMQGNPV